MDNESWITASEALEMGFATKIADSEDSKEPTQSARQMIRDRILAAGTEDRKEDKILEKLDAVLKAVQKRDDPKDLDDGEQNYSNKKVVAFLNVLSK